MSYDITFIRKSDSVTLDNINSILEDTDVESTDFDFLSLEFKNELIKQLKDEGLKFEIFQAKEGTSSNYFELNFPTYQVVLFDNQISISVPYWDDNTSEQVNKEVKAISNILLDNGFIGYDPQIGKLITEKFDFKDNFTASQEMVKGHLNQENNESVSTPQVAIIFLIVVVAFLLFKAMKLFR